MTMITVIIIIIKITSYFILIHFSIYIYKEIKQHVHFHQDMSKMDQSNCGCMIS